MKKGILYCMLVLSSFISNAQFNGPESVDYHRATNTYFVSNTGSQKIRQFVPGGAVTDFVSPGGAPYGIEVIGDTLYACVSGSVKTYAIPSGTPGRVFPLGGSFLNGIAHDNSGNLFVSDFSAKKIYKIRLSDGNSSTYVAATGSTPNGLVWDETGNRLLVASWGSAAKVKAVNPADSTLSDLIQTPFGNIDGIAIDDSSRIYLSPWSAAAIIRYASDLSTILDTADNMNNPADIYYNRWTDSLAVPNAGNNTVVFVNYHVETPVDTTDTTTTSIRPMFEGNEGLIVYPNPATEQVFIQWISKEQDEFAQISLMNECGILVSNQYIKLAAGRSRTEHLDLSNLSPGLYTLMVKTERVWRYTKLMISNP